MDYYEEFCKYRYWLGMFIPIEMRKEAEEFLMNCEEKYIPYIIDKGNMYNWENAVKIIEKINYPANKQALSSVMYLLMDVNWTYAQNAINIIEKIYKHEPEYVVRIMEETILIAEQKNDTSWLYGISYVKEQLKIKDSAFSSTDVINILKKGEYYD